MARTKPSNNSNSALVIVGPVTLVLHESDVKMIVAHPKMIQVKRFIMVNSFSRMERKKDSETQRDQFFNSGNVIQ